MPRESYRDPKTPIIVCIDVEPDEPACNPNERKDWLGFEETWKCFKHLRPSLALAVQSHVRFNWYLRMDPQVTRIYGSANWAVTRYSEFFDEMHVAGDDIGLHPHARRWNDSQQEWISDFANQDWIDHCVLQSFDNFERQFKRPCRDFRFGDRWMNNRTISFIERLGAQFDLTIEPGRKSEDMAETFTGSFPDYTSAPRHHYRPSKPDFLTPGSILTRRKIWLIPVATANVNWAVAPLPPETRCMNAPVAAAYKGCFDHVDQAWIVGWVYDAEHPDQTMNIDLYVDDELIGTYAADFFRSDLFDGKGGAHGFTIPPPEWKKDGKLHRIRIKVAGTHFGIDQSPKEVAWKCDAGDDFVTLNLAYNDVLFSRFFDALINRQKPSVLAFVLRSDSMLVPELAGYIKRNLEYIVSHPPSSGFAITTPDEALQILERAA
jgi:hypothetical protein